MYLLLCTDIIYTILQGASFVRVLLA